MNNLEVESTNLDTFLKQQFIEMNFDFEVKSIYTFKRIGHYWMNKKAVAKYLNFCATV